MAAILRELVWGRMTAAACPIAAAPSEQTGPVACFGRCGAGSAIGVCESPPPSHPWMSARTFVRDGRRMRRSGFGFDLRQYCVLKKLIRYTFLGQLGHVCKEPHGRRRLSRWFGWAQA